MHTRVLVVLAVLAAGFAFPCNAHAQSFPAKPIKLIVPFPPGSQPDTLARVVAEFLSASLGTVIIDNRPGGGGMVGMKAAAGADPDGHTLVLGTTGSLAIGPAFFPSAGFDATASFVPVAMIAGAPFLIVVSPAVPVSSVQELVAYGAANPGKLSFGAATGSPPHLACEWFKRATGADITHVPARGPQAVTDLLGGHVQVVCEATTLLLPQIQAGGARALAVMSAARLPQLPNVPTTAEVALPGLMVNVWSGVLAPAGTPRTVTARINDEINKGLRSAELQATLAKLGTEPMPQSAEAFAAFVAVETRKWADIIQLSGTKPN